MLGLAAAFDGCEFFFGVCVHLGLDPLVDLGPMEAPLTADSLGRDVATAGPLTQVARIALQVSGQLGKAHHLVSHGYAPLLALAAWHCSPGRNRRHFDNNPGNSKPLPPLSSWVRACVCWPRPHRRINPCAAS